MKVETRSVSSSAYLGRAATLRPLTHSVEVDGGGRAVRVLCGTIGLGNLAEASGEDPTCRRCVARLKIAEGTMKPRRRAQPGDRFGRLTLLRRSERKSGAGRLMFWCRCDCGTEKEIILCGVVNGFATSCGCWKREAPKVHGVARRADLVGKEFGVLTVEALSDLVTHGDFRWACVCTCGGRTTATTTQLRSGAVTSCGCVRLAKVSERHAKLHEWRGRTVTLQELEAVSGIPVYLLKSRIHRAGWSVEKAISTPNRQAPPF